MSDLSLIFDILEEVIYREGKSTDLINKYARSIKNLPLATRLVYGLLENKIYIDYMIRKLSDIRLKKIHKSVLIILEIGIYNIHFLETKDYATVDKLVDLTKKKNKRSAGFVNAILRNFIRDEKEIATIYETDDIKSLSIRYSMPEEITRYIYDFYGMDYTKAFLRDANKEREISIRINLLKTDKDRLRKSLEAEGFIVSDGRLSDTALRIKNPAGLAKTRLFKEGYFTIQQESSQMAIRYLDPRPGSRVLDLCAAPGTKTSYIGEYTKNGAHIVANDISEAKNHLIEENIKRLGLKNISITNYDASEDIKEFKDSFDYVLVDAPCSGLGVLGRKPEIRYNRTKETILRLGRLQQDILDRAISYLRPGGSLVYSTCTLGPVENKDNFAYLLSKDELSHVKLESKDFIEYRPFETGTDGFFISKFRKRND